MPDLFSKFGGHRQAAGVTMDSAMVEAFRERMRAYAAERLTPADFERELAIDAEIGIEEITDSTVADILRLAPFGFGNPSPLFAVRGIEVAAPPEIRKEKHVFFGVRMNGRILRVKAWDFARRADELQPGERIDAALQFEDGHISFTEANAVAGGAERCQKSKRRLAGLKPTGRGGGGGGGRAEPSTAKLAMTLAQGCPGCSPTFRVVGCNETSELIQNYTEAVRKQASESK